MIELPTVKQNGPQKLLQLSELDHSEVINPFGEHSLTNHERADPSIQVSTQLI